MVCNEEVAVAEEAAEVERGEDSAAEVEKAERSCGAAAMSRADRLAGHTMQKSDPIWRAAQYHFV